MNIGFQWRIWFMGRLSGMIPHYHKPAFAGIGIVPIEWHRNELKGEKGNGHNDAHYYHSSLGTLVRGRRLLV